MHKEIERKYLVRSNAFESLAQSHIHIRQAYLCPDEIILRIRQWNDHFFLTVKGPSPGGLSRTEVEKPLSRSEFEALLPLARGHIIEKIRYLVPWNGLTIEVDRFISPRKGLVLAEIELPDEKTKPQLPPWLGEEVTGRPEYYNAYMAKNG